MRENTLISVAIIKQQNKRKPILATRFAGCWSKKNYSLVKNPEKKLSMTIWTHI